LNVYILILIYLQYSDSWMKNGVNIPGGSRTWSSNSGDSIRQVGGSLVFASLKQSDSGEYSCVARNTAGRTVRSTHLTVSSPLVVQVCISLKEII